MKNNNFAGGIGGEAYDLFMGVLPHYNDFQNQIGVEVTNGTRAMSGLLKILEIGTGTGMTSEVLLGASDRYQLTTIDDEPKMITQARANLAKFGDRVIVVEEEAKSYLARVPKNSVDVFASGWTLHNFTSDDRVKILDQIYLALKPDGIFVNGDKYAQSDALKHRSAFAETIASIKAVGEKHNDEGWTKEWVDHYHFDERDEIRMDEEFAKQYMSNIGFKDIRTVHRTGMDAIMVARK